MHKFKIYSIDEGYCRITYKTKNADNETIYYGLCDMGCHREPEIILHRLTQDGEPSHPVKLKVKAKDTFEMPEGDSVLIKACRKWIENN